MYAVDQSISADFSSPRLQNQLFRASTSSAGLQISNSRASLQISKFGENFIGFS